MRIDTVLPLVGFYGRTNEMRTSFSLTLLKRFPRRPKLYSPEQYTFRIKGATVRWGKSVGSPADFVRLSTDKEMTSLLF